MPHQLALGQDVPLHGPEEFLFGRARFQRQGCVQRVQLEEVTVRPSRRRTGPAVANTPEIIQPLPRPAR